MENSSSERNPCHDFSMISLFQLKSKYGTVHMFYTCYSAYSNQINYTLATFRCGKTAVFLYDVKCKRITSYNTELSEGTLLHPGSCHSFTRLKNVEAFFAVVNCVIFERALQLLSEEYMKLGFRTA